MTTPLWQPDAIGEAGPVLRHYTERLAANADWQALCAAIVAKRDALVVQLVGPSCDNATVERLHALRGQIRTLNDVLDAPRREAANHNARHTA